MAFTLRMREVLARLIPVLGGIKKDPIRWVFAAALGRFAEAYLHFIANAEDDKKSQVSSQSFAQEMSAAFDVIHTNWIGSSEAKVLSLSAALPSPFMMTLFLGAICCR
jgi:hypothetical protein